MLTRAVQTIVKNAMREHRLLRVDETPSADHLAIGVDKLNLVLDQLAAARCGVYRLAQGTFTLAPGVQPHTLGESGATWTVGRPETIDAMTVTLAGGGDVPVPIHHSAERWFAIPDKTTTGEIPREGYYDRLVPSGALYLWPVPTTALTVTLALRFGLGEVTGGDSLVLPAGWARALELRLALAIARPYGKTVSADLVNDSNAADAVIFLANDQGVGGEPVDTIDAGMPGFGDRGGGWDYRVGMRR